MYLTGLERPGELPVRLQAFFHIHGARGVLHGERRISVNASKCDDGCRATLAPVVLELN